VDRRTPADGDVGPCEPPVVSEPKKEWEKVPNENIQISRTDPFTLYYYDALGRTNRIQNPLGYSASISYDPVTGWVTSQTDFTGQTTTYQYYGTNQANAGKLKCQTSATGKNTYYSYTTQGKLYQTWGDVPYPAQYSYNEYGDLTNLLTFRGGTGWTGSAWPTSPGTGDSTTWVYDPASGALLQKVDAQGDTVSYTYDTTTGRLLTRSWARTLGGIPVTETNGYDGFGDLTEQDYSDGTASVYYNNFNRAGQPREIVDASGTSELAYDYASRLITSTYASGVLSGITVSNHFNPYFGRDAVAVLGLSGPLEDDYLYDAYGRLGVVSCGTNSATYGYAANSDLLQATTFRNGANTVLTTSRTWDYGMRLRSIANVVNNLPVTSHSYLYDALNRRTAATLEDGSVWQYGYDNRDELTVASRSWPAWEYNAPVSGQQFTYAYDNIGNRLTAGSGGDVNGQNLRTNTYANNSLNEYTGIQTPGYVSIIGAALATNSVTVNGGAADRKAEYFHKEIAVANGTGPVWQNVTNTSGTFTSQGGLLVPASAQTLTYDADGNLTADGIWTYQWDGENRLISMAMTPSVQGIANSNVLRLDFTYDYLGRRVQKVVSVWNGTGFTPQSTSLFVYDGWNLLAVVNSQAAIQRSFMWGNDLSGTMDQAGGVGGLLLASISSTNCFVTYDGNGNITSLVNAADKSLAARYEYSPFGELVRQTGSMAQDNPFQFSTKYRESESGVIYYGIRYYEPKNGNWLGRDKSEETGGLNLMSFLLNSPTTGIDSYGNVRIDYDGKGLHVHDQINGQKITYGISLDKNGQVQLTQIGGKHANEFDANLARQSFRDILQDPESFQKLLAVNQDAGLVYKGARGVINDVNGVLRNVGRAAGAAGALLAIATAAQGSQEIAASVDDYARDSKNGNTAYADLDAVDVAIGVQDMTGNYFITTDVLGTMMQ
jgi:RHS repeat-associated protein